MYDEWVCYERVCYKTVCDERVCLRGCAVLAVITCWTRPHSHSPPRDDDAPHFHSHRAYFLLLGLSPTLLLTLTLDLDPYYYLPPMPFHLANRPSGCLHCCHLLREGMGGKGREGKRGRWEGRFKLGLGRARG